MCVWSGLLKSAFDHLDVNMTACCVKVTGVYIEF